MCLAQLGHSSIQITVDLYGHFGPGGDRHHAEGLAAAIEAERMVAEARILSPTRIRFSHLMAPSWHPA